MSLDVGNIDLADIVEDSMKVVSQAAAERNISLARHGPQHLVLEADRRALKQVFLNLLSNAVKFTRDGGSVDVHLSRSRGHVKIAIKDTGIGIPEADIAKLGRPFEQVENQFSKSHQGSGLGLAISRALVELHGGALRITSREGQGTTVTCTLPVAARDRRRRAEARRLRLIALLASRHDAVEGLVHGGERVFQRRFERGEVRHVRGAGQQILQRARRLVRHERLVETEPQHLGQRVIEPRRRHQNLGIAGRQARRPPKAWSAQARCSDRAPPGAPPRSRSEGTGR